MRDADRKPEPARRAAAIRDSRLEALRLAPELVMEIQGHARECHPEECCGLVLGTNGAPERVLRMANVQSQRKARGESDLDARRGFWIDPAELLSALREGETSGQEPVAVYHSHVDAEAYLSVADLDGALGPGGQPLYPGCAQIVVSVFEDGVREMTWFDWDERQGSFIGREIRQAAP